MFIYALPAPHFDGFLELQDSAIKVNGHERLALIEQDMGAFVAAWKGAMDGGWQPDELWENRSRCIPQGLALVQRRDHLGGRSRFELPTKHNVPNWSIAKLDRLSPKESS